MKAIVCHELSWARRAAVGGRAGAASRTRPGAGYECGPVGVNFADSLIVRVASIRRSRKPPFSPGFEVAGEVMELGAEVEGLAVGDRVIAMTPHGGYAEQVVASASRCVAMPAAMPDAHGAAFPVVFGTSHVALWHRARLQAGETLVVHGAGRRGRIDGGGHRQAAGRDGYRHRQQY
jgi:NADPH2:quinone reductase